jgi:ABC-type nitrate/sulfonate/bicarbonate transport system substrate-binding protein
MDRRRALGGLASVSLAALLPARVCAQVSARATMAYGSTGYTWATAFVAEAINSWKDNGVILNAVDFPTGRDAMQALLAGSAEFSTATETPLIFAAMRGLRPVILLNYSRYSRDMKIVVRTDRGIDPRNPASLKGHRIATQVGTSGQYMLARYCQMAGIAVKDVTIMDMAPADMIAATSRGDIDGFSWTREAALLAERQSGGKVAAMTQDGLEKFFRSHELLLTTEKVIKENPALLDDAVKAYMAAETYMKANANWPETIAKRVHNTPAEVQDGVASFEFKIVFDDQFLDDMVTEAQWAIDAGLMKQPGEDLRKLFRGLIYEAPLKRLYPDRVTLTSG